MRRGLVFVLLALAASAGCSRDRPAAGSDTITILQPGDERLLGPYWDMSGQFLMFLPMVVANDRGEIEGQLAERWEHSADYRTWTFTLRDVRWHDGTPVTAADVVFTWNLRTNPQVVQGLTRSMVVEALDARTVRITNRDPDFTLDDWSTFFPHHILSELDLKDAFTWDFWIRPVGNGPYRYVRHVPQTLVELRANPGYFRGQPKITRVILKLAQSPAITELLSGNVDAASMVSRLDAHRLSSDDRFRIYHQMGADWVHGIQWNAARAQFRDSRVRRALTLAIDRAELARTLNMPAGLRLADGLFLHEPYMAARAPAALPHDADAARRLLDDAGWRDLDGDGVRESAGTALRFTAVVPARGGFEGNGLPEAALYVQDQLRRVGARMDIVALEPPMLRRRLRTGDFEALFDRLFNSVGSHTERFGRSSPLGYRSERAAALFEAARTAPTPQRRDEVYREIGELTRDDMPFTFLYPQVHTFVAHRRIAGLSSPHRADPVRYLEFLWLDEQR